MNEEQWRDERDNRTLRYAGRRLDPDRWVAITAPSTHVWRYDCQVALLTLANLLSRMTPSVALSFQDAPVHPALPWAKRSLHEVILAQMCAADPYGRFEVRGARLTDYRMHFGPDGPGDMIIHGSGWNTHLGPSPSPLQEYEDTNPFGAGLAAVVAASQLFVHDFAPLNTKFIANALTWRNEIAPDNPPVPGGFLGDIWAIGVGSVGSAALYFLALAKRQFRATLVDMDRVKRWNLDRSPIFVEEDVGDYKVDVAKAFLDSAGISAVRTETAPLHEVEAWAARQPGTPDLVISAANEFDVRYHIESQSPPIQIYGTTGQNWQASLLRHIPLADACSCCLFPSEAPRAPMTCATAPPEQASDSEEQVDAALPFLSFGAGLMTAAEILKLSLPGYPFSANRVMLTMRPEPRLVASRLARKERCICRDRHKSVLRVMLEGSRHAVLSKGQLLA